MKVAMNAAFICNDTEPFKEYGIRVCKHGVERAVQFVVLSVWDSASKHLFLPVITDILQVSFVSR